MLRVGILALANPCKGLMRDAAAVLWAINGSRDFAVVSVFGVTVVPSSGQLPESITASDPRAFLVGDSGEEPDDAGLHAQAVAAGTTFAHWSAGLDVLLTFEFLPLVAALRFVEERMGRVVYVPNLEYATALSLPGETEVQAWVRMLRGFGHHLTVVAKSERALSRMQEAGIEAFLVPWSIPDLIVQDRQIGRGRRFLLNAGMGGWANRRGADLALAAFQLAREKMPDLELTVKSNADLNLLDARRSSADGVHLICKHISRAEIKSLYSTHDVVLYPSRFEGFGLSLLEALHAGAPVIATDGWPMNELVEHEHNGLLVAAARQPDLRLAWRGEPSVGEIAAAMLRLAEDERLRWRLTCPEPGELLARQRAFCVRIRSAILGEVPPEVLLLHGADDTSSTRRAEHFWSDALKACGYQVMKRSYGEHQDIERTLSQTGPRFVLAGKIPVEELQWLRKQPRCPKVIIWHHDWIDSNHIRQSWSKRVAALADLYVAPHVVGTPNGRMILPGASAFGDRGPGRRARTYGPAGGGARTLFIGNVCGGCRNDLLARLAADRSIGLRIHGHNWETTGLMAVEPLWDLDRDVACRRADLTLSISATNAVPGYTSDRLLNSAAVGARVAAHEFPGLDEMYSTTAVARFHEHNMMEVVERLHRELPEQRDAARREAEATTWRRHTWNDRVLRLLEMVDEICETEHNAISPDSRPLRLNIGCGPDVRAGYLNIDWRARPGVRQHDLREGLPFLDTGSVDEVLANDILEHFPRSTLTGLILPELRRVLRPGGTLRVQLPDLRLIAEQFLHGKADAETTACRIYGRQDYRGNVHYWGYTQDTFGTLLRAAGFSAIRRVQSVNWNMRLEACAGEALVEPATVKSEPRFSRQHTAASAAYWTERATRSGARAVGPGSWDLNTLADATTRWWQKIARHLEPFRRPSRAVLDLGCGAGRFLPLLDDLFHPEKLHALDVSPRMLEMAQAVEGKLPVHFRQIEDVAALPLANSEVDVIWCCTVLQHVPDAIFATLCAELRRVAAPGALMVLTENTFEAGRRTSSTGHVVFRSPQEYVDAFPGLAVGEHFEELQERHTIFIGTLNELQNRNKRPVMDLVIPVMAPSGRARECRLRNLKMLLAAVPQTVHVIVVEQRPGKPDTRDDSMIGELRARMPAGHGSPTFLCVDFPGDFNKAWLYNIGVAAAVTNTVILADGDIVPEATYFDRVAEYVENTPQPWGFCWNRIRYLNEDLSSVAFEDVPRPGYSEGGLVYFNKAFYYSIGGANEWLSQLGGIDNELALRARHASGAYPAMAGVIDHYWHPVSPMKSNHPGDGTRRLVNRELVRTVQRDPSSAIRELIRFRDEIGGKEPLPARHGVPEFFQTPGSGAAPIARLSST
jgi:glycosyltransferase involved in cell wall biosynthesis/SAM-dependent methyltransferase